jgi:hypothetical protein
MRALLVIALIARGSSFASAQTHYVQLRKGATEVGDGFYLRITAQLQGPMPSRPQGWAPDITWWKFKMPHQLGKDTIGTCVLRTEDWRGQTLSVLYLTPSPTSEGRNEEEFDIIAVPKLAKTMHLTIQYNGTAEWGGRIIARQYRLQLRDYMSLVK